jgi:hypothetical protein
MLNFEGFWIKFGLKLFELRKLDKFARKVIIPKFSIKIFVF